MSAVLQQVSPSPVSETPVAVAAESAETALAAQDPVQVLHKVVQELPDACERLAYVRSMTEEAATKVLGLVDAAQDDAEQVRRQGSDLSETLCRMALAPDLTVDRARQMLKLCAAYAANAASFASREKSLHTEIMMAQGFQDLSGQVINKVVGMLESVEAPLEHMLAQFEPPKPEFSDSASQSLEGVQTPDKALQQDDVDDLLASLGF
ncbi:protein phosphatase CheZ [Paucibacter sp. Y2R2-4]|uniref:protein phosphatase CheZ n=1 Tax=Paucibacter sp. Y2R2-4 TaxID=2893553 RepID=UPI0021E36B84|nr:protein phosphatase CheZ [Paucibacter sp. Y2R2-4]MCV2350112.1 protein phosphatase CheZ [Paucibacter sp. Y2R2-4]